MNKSTVAICVALAAGLVAGCSSSLSERDEITARGQDKVHEAYARQKQPSEFRNLRYTNEYYIPELTKEAEDKPAWWFDKINGSVLSLTLQDTMNDFLLPHGIMTRYLDGISGDEALIESVPSGTTLGELIKKISFVTGYSYAIDNDLLTWSKYQVSRFKVNALSGSAEAQYGSEKQESSSSVGGFGSRMSQTQSGFDTNEDYTVYKVETGNIWSDIEESLGVLKSESGSVSVNKSTTSILVKDYPENIAQIDSYIKDLNLDLGTVVALDIEIISFSSTEDDSKALDWSVIKQGLNATGAISLTTSFADLAGDTAPTVLEYSRESGKYAGSSALFRVLDKNGVSYRVTRKRAISMNNYPSSIVYGDDTAFAEEAGSNSTANVGTNQTLRLGKVRTGEQLHMLPSVNGENVFLTLSTSLNKLKDIRKIESGGSTVEGPEVGLDKMTTRLKIRDGDTMVLSNSISEEKATASNDGIRCFLLGCSVSDETLKEERLILITPRVRRD